MSLPMLKGEVAKELRKVLADMAWDKGRILETGTGYGESAAFFAKEKPYWSIYTVDGFGLYGDGRIYDQWDREKVKKINEALPSNVIQILGNSQKISWELLLDLLFIDADHSYEGCKADFDNYAHYVRFSGFICFDDYNQPNNPANGVKKVVAEVLETGKYQVIYEGFYCIILKKLTRYAKSH